MGGGKKGKEREREKLPPDKIKILKIKVEIAVLHKTFPNIQTAKKKGEIITEIRVPVISYRLLRIILIIYTYFCLEKRRNIKFIFDLVIFLFF